MGIYDDLSKLDTVAPPPKWTSSSREQNTHINNKERILVDQSTDQSTKRPVNHPADRSTDQRSKVDTLGPIVDRPRAFYITQKVDRWLDEAVRYLRDNGIHKMDRSVLVNALIHNPDHFKPTSLEKIRQRLLDHLINKSLRRSKPTD